MSLPLVSTYMWLLKQETKLIFVNIVHIYLRCNELRVNFCPHSGTPPHRHSPPRTQILPLFATPTCSHVDHPVVEMRRISSPILCTYSQTAVPKQAAACAHQSVGAPSRRRDCRILSVPHVSSLLLVRQAAERGSFAPDPTVHPRGGPGHLRGGRSPPSTSPPFSQPRESDGECV